MNKFKHLQQKAITVRFSIADYLKIEQEAENLGSNLADVMRKAWIAYNSSQDFKTDLKNSENRLISKIFEVCSAVQGLTEQEREEAFHELKIRLNGGSK
ncbi:hypothetical protein RS130_07730 [Paraglaciecola aquimarina]|uniref:Ribbon-helix-helix protein CopG domain-containing protein n=1 Tax=Paraglaciecola aquimarina TaxID=1235557 RepID=A0ABU3SUY1_9ALTE|nr:hypothetical protein [Paraglaciecola aquimarina]MDU0353830.1 hypothetical protein [Paraglaciecola aquimarina]